MLLFQNFTVAASFPTIILPSPGKRLSSQSMDVRSNLFFAPPQNQCIMVLALHIYYDLTIRSDCLYCSIQFQYLPLLLPQHQMYLLWLRPHDSCLPWIPDYIRVKGLIKSRENMKDTGDVSLNSWTILQIANFRKPDRSEFAVTPSIEFTVR